MRFTFFSSSRSLKISVFFPSECFFFSETQQKILKNLWSCFLCYLALLFHSLYNITSYNSSSKECERNSEHAFVIFHIPFFLWCRGAFFLWLVCRFCFIQPTDCSQVRRSLWVHFFVLFSLHSRVAGSFDPLELNVEFATSNWREVRCWWVENATS